MDNEQTQSDRAVNVSGLLKDPYADKDKVTGDMEALTAEIAVWSNFYLAAYPLF